MEAPDYHRPGTAGVSLWVMTVLFTQPLPHCHAAPPPVPGTQHPRKKGTHAKPGDQKGAQDRASFSQVKRARAAMGYGVHPAGWGWGQGH